jgi:hypothetical protein
MFTTTQLSQLKQSLGVTESRSSPPYFAEYLPAPGGEAEIDMTKHPGLDFYYVVRDGGPQQRVATVWRSRELYLRDGERLRTALQAPPVLTHGFIGSFAMPGKPIWKRVPWYTALLGLAAALGAVQAIGNHFDWLFAAPSLTMKSDKSRIHLTEALDFVETIALVNDLPIAHRNLELVGAITAAASAPTPAARLTMSPASVAYIVGSGTHEITVSGVAPRHGKYELIVDVSAKGGQLRDSGKFRFSRPVTVWPKNPVGTLNVRKVQEQMALLRGELAVGPAAPNGLDCELEFRGTSGLRYDELFDFPNLHKSARWRSTDSPGNEVAVLQWVVLPVGARELIPFQAAITRAGTTDWNQVVERSAVRCYYRQETAR